MVAGVILAVRALRSFTKVRMVKQIKVQNKLNYKASLSGRLVPPPLNRAKQFISNIFISNINYKALHL